MHYGISRLPSTDYKPRKADDRVGYFLTVRKNFSDKEDDQHFVRYINRWNLKKETIGRHASRPRSSRSRSISKRRSPRTLRPYVAEGILEWNKAFEKLGYYNAIHVYQPGEYETREEDIDPEDINYNFFRWITAEAGFAMGPSRVNPEDGRNPRRRHHLRRQLPALLEAGIRSDDAADASPSSSDIPPGGRLSRSSWKKSTTPGARRRPSMRLLPGDAAPDGLCRLGADGPRPDRRQGQAAGRIHPPGPQGSR